MNQNSSLENAAIALTSPLSTSNAASKMTHRYVRLPKLRRRTRRRATRPKVSAGRWRRRSAAGDAYAERGHPPGSPTPSSAGWNAELGRRPVWRATLRVAAASLREVVAQPVKRRRTPTPLVPRLPPAPPHDDRRPADDPRGLAHQGQEVQGLRLRVVGDAALVQGQGHHAGPRVEAQRRAGEDGALLLQERPRPRAPGLDVPPRHHRNKRGRPQVLRRRAPVAVLRAPRGDDGRARRLGRGPQGARRRRPGRDQGQARAREGAAEEVGGSRALRVRLALRRRPRGAAARPLRRRPRPLPRRRRRAAPRRRPRPRPRLRREPPRRPPRPVARPPRRPPPRRPGPPRRRPRPAPRRPGPPRPAPGRPGPPRPPPVARPGAAAAAGVAAARRRRARLQPARRRDGRHPQRRPRVAVAGEAGPEARRLRLRASRARRRAARPRRAPRARVLRRERGPRARAARRLGADVAGPAPARDGGPEGRAGARRAAPRRRPAGGGAGQGFPNVEGSLLGRCPLVSADVWTSDHRSERSRDAFS